jgi:hypothetical protein
MDIKRCASFFLSNGRELTSSPCERDGRGKNRFQDNYLERRELLGEKKMHCPFPDEKTILRKGNGGRD